MEVKNIWQWIGKVKIDHVKNNKIIKTKTIFNMITNNALNEILKALYNETNLQLAYLAIGDDDTAAAASDTELGNEIYRTPIISKLKTGTGELTSRAILLDTEPYEAPSPPSHDQCTIKEIGFFAGTDATTTIDSGLLLSRIVLTTPETKQDNEQIQFTRTDTFERG